MVEHDHLDRIPQVPLLADYWLFRNEWGFDTGAELTSIHQ